MSYPTKGKQLCAPAAFYFIFSIIGLVLMMLQYIGNHNKYHLGSYSCNVSSTPIIFLLKLIYVLFWTWVLNLICKDGHSGISWLLVLFPIILLFVLLGLMMM